MKIIKEIYEAQIDKESLTYIDANTSFMDIETTGFSRLQCHIYMIGLARIVDVFDDTTVQYEVTLLFAEDLSDEINVLRKFLDYSSSVKKYITFNGLTFDFPFIKSRLKLYGIRYDYNDYEQLDIYKCCKKLKPILQLSNLKQKTIEEFLGLSREDQYFGGELISQYEEYTKTGDSSLYHNLITHNLEDVKGMVDLLAILRYANIANLIDKSNEPLITVERSSGYVIEICTTLQLSCNLPKRFNIKSEFYYMIFEYNIIKIILKPIHTSLNYYLKDYKNYRYLSNEEIIIPKQLLNNHNKKFARPVTKEQCYVVHEGLFLPVYDETMFDGERLYKMEYAEKALYVDIKDKLDDSIYIRNYIIHVINFLL